jgi:integrase
MKRVHSFSRIRKSVVVHGVARSELGGQRSRLITSVGTGRVTEQAEKRFLEWRRENGLDLDGPYLRAEVTEFLDEFAETHGQSALDATRLGIGRVLGIRFPNVTSLQETVRRGRAVTWEEVRKIVQHQSGRNVLATLIAFDGGLRASELLTIARVGEIEPSAHRTWPESMFLGREDCVTMMVAGKGGLRRPVAVARPLAEALETYRRPQPVSIADRGVFHESFYDLGGGQAFSQSFSDASRKAVAASMGAHGLRHGFAQRRVTTLTAHGFEFMRAIQLVSIELGHFRPVLAYQTPR